jgi:hypothetical protein
MATRVLVLKYSDPTDSGTTPDLETEIFRSAASLNLRENLPNHLKLLGFPHSNGNEGSGAEIQ